MRMRDVFMLPLIVFLFIAGTISFFLYQNGKAQRVADTTVSTVVN